MSSYVWRTGSDQSARSFYRCFSSCCHFLALPSFATSVAVRFCDALAYMYAFCFVSMCLRFPFGGLISFSLVTLLNSFLYACLRVGLLFLAVRCRHYDVAATFFISPRPVVTTWLDAHRGPANFAGHVFPSRRSPREDVGCMKCAFGLRGAIARSIVDCISLFGCFHELRCYRLHLSTPTFTTVVLLFFHFYLLFSHSLRSNYLLL